MVTSWTRPTRLHISRKAIQHNISHELARLKDNQELFAVIKANGYGHGAVQIAKAAQEAGAKGFCVATLDEAIELRHNGFWEPVLVMGVVHSSHAPAMSELAISATVTSLSWLKEAEQALQLYPYLKTLAIHLKVDTGMGRLGFSEEQDFLTAISFLKQSQSLEFEGVFTHFATADETTHDYYQSQETKFKRFMALLDEKPRYIHTANSATALWHEDTQSTLIRFGIAMYGLNPSGKTQPPPFELKPALSLTTELVHVKRLKKGMSISYGATYTAQEDEWIGTLPIGYADGWRRSLQGFSVLIEGQRAEIVGRICMDQCMIRLPSALPVGTLVTLVGQNQEASISLEEVATYVDTINYEITCGFTERLPREYD